MDMHKISISFKADRLHIYNYLKSTEGIKDNISAYICNLIEKDMQNTPTSALEEQVKALLQKLIGNVALESLASTISSNEDNVVSTEDIDLINHLF